MLIVDVPVTHSDVASPDAVTGKSLVKQPITAPPLNELKSASYKSSRSQSQSIQSLTTNAQFNNSN